MTAPAAPRGSWVGRHKLLATTLAALATLAVAGAFDMVGAIGGGPASDETGTVSPAAEEPSVDRPTPSEEPSLTEAPEPSRTPSPPPEPTPRPRTYLVTYVVDGDTVDLANGETVRLAGIDTPERGECGYEESTAHMERLVLGKRVTLAESDEDRDGYGRLLRYVDVGRTDAGLEQIRAGLAIAKYDSRDGYGFHPRENRYIAVDEASRDFDCPKPLGLVPQPPPANSCAPGYDPCVPAYPPDVDCPDVNGPILVTGSDPHGLDRDGDGIACE